MLKANRIYLLLLLIFAFSFFYRIVLLFLEGYPPGADIGLHNSVIYSITGSGSTNFLYNFYHMGGGISLTFPGYHIFTAGIMILTGMTGPMEYVAQALVVSLFSSLTVLCAFLITRRLWSTSAALIVAFLVAISRFDIEMLMWGGYPNVITLLLIPLTYYLYLQKDRFSLTPFLVSTSIIAGSIFLTHSLSTAIYVGITFLVVFFVLAKPKIFGIKRRTGLYWLLPIVLGAILFSPFIIQAVPEYLNNNSTLDSAGSNAIKVATLATRKLPLEMVLPLFGVLAGFLVFSKKYFGRFLALPTFLLSMWLLVPLVLTQGYLIGFAVDYNRFLYFLILPLMIFIAVFIEHGSSFFSKKISDYTNLTSKTHKTVKLKLTRLLAGLTKSQFYSGFILFFLLLSFLALPIFMGPIYNAGQTIQEYYQTMNNQGWEAIQWAKTNTPTDSLFVSDALYGWWFGGFAQRRTLSAVDPQYLSINEEYNKTLFARNILDTDYLIDNGLIQVREDGGYIARHNPEIVAKLTWTYSPYTFFVFDSNETKISYKIEGVSQSKNETQTLDQLNVKEMRMEKDTQHATIIVTRGNDYFNYTQLTTVYKGLRFVNLTTIIDSTVPGVSFDELIIEVQSKGNQTKDNDDYKSTIAMFDEPMKVLGQLIFNVNQPLTPVNVTDTIVGKVTQRRVQLKYDLEGKQSSEIQISASAYSVSDDPTKYSNEDVKNIFLSKLIALNMNPNQTPDDTKDWEQVFDYNLEMQTYNVSYIVCRVPEMYPKFFRDPSFNFAFFNNGTHFEKDNNETIKVINEIAIFMVNGNIK